IRFAPLVKQRGASVVVSCPAPLVPLLTSCAGIDHLVAQGEPLPVPVDVQASLLSLPPLLGTTLQTIPAQVPYLTADPQRAEHGRKELAKTPGFKVGIAWQGDPQHKNDCRRSVPLTMFELLAAIPGVRLYSIQKGAGREQLAALAGRFAVEDLADRLEDFAD